MSAEANAQPAALLRRLPASTWVAVAVLVGLLTVANLVLMPDVVLETSPTSYGRSLLGYGAVYDLLGELGFRVSRSRALYAELPADQPLWLLRPALAPEAEPSAGGSDDDGEKGDKDKDGVRERLERFASTTERGLLESLRRYVETGGTVVLIGADPEVFSTFGLSLAAPRTRATGRAMGPLSRVPRALDADGLARFAGDAGGEPLLAVDGEPFALLLQVGTGHVVAVADARPFTNDRLDKADHSLLAVDLARAFGAPRFDERSHGLHSEATLAGALGAQRLVLLGAGLSLLALLWLWHGRSVPPRTLPVSEGLDPSLSPFIESLSFLYARKGPQDVRAVYHAYVHGLRHRLRRAVYGRGRGSDQLLSQRLARELTADPELYACIEGKHEPRNSKDLERDVRRMEGYMATALWHASSRSGKAKR